MSDFRPEYEPWVFDAPKPADTQVDERTCIWIARALDRAADADGRVSKDDAYSVAIAAGNRVIRVMGGL